jgi:hypothetical protein
MAGWIFPFDDQETVAMPFTPLAAKGLGCVVERPT